MTQALERFTFTNPPANWPTPDSMLYDGVTISQLTMDQAIDALTVAGRAVQQPAHLQRLLLDIKERQDRFNRMWTILIGLSALALGMWLGSMYF